MNKTDLSAYLSVSVTSDLICHIWVMFPTCKSSVFKHKELNCFPSTKRGLARALPMTEYEWWDNLMASIWCYYRLPVSQFECDLHYNNTFFFLGLITHNPISSALIYSWLLMSIVIGLFIIIYNQTQCNIFCGLQ